MKLSDLGEFGLIKRIAPQFTKNLQQNILGIGDDCSVIPDGAENSLLVTTDLLIEDIHFLRNKISPFELGHKSLAVNLSDIAAMGGYPTGAFLSIGLPKDIEIQWLDNFFEGLFSLSEKTNTPLLGGDTTKSKKSIIINMAVLGKAQPGKIKYRSTAKPGDIIFVTNNLGDSGGGLNVLLNNIDPELDADLKSLVHAHHNPRPHLKEGQWLASLDQVHAMIDISDGIDSDIKRIMEQSKVGANVDVENIPLSSRLKNVSLKQGWNAVEIAATGGEDYCLLCTVKSDAAVEIQDNFLNEFGRPLYKLGQITDSGELTYFHDGSKIDFSTLGFDHFCK